MPIGDLSAEDKAFFDSRGETQAPTDAGLLNGPKVEAEPVEEEVKEPEVEPEEKDGEDKPKQRLVPHEALHEAKLTARRERDQRKALEKQFQESQIHQARMEERFRTMMERIQPKQEADPEPDKGDIAAHLEWKNRQLEAKVTTIEQRDQQVQQHAQQEQNRQQFVGAYRSAVQEFAADKPDFNDAYQHVVGERAKMLRALGYKNPEQIQRIIHYEEEGLVRSAFADGENPGQRIYEAAKALGYTGKKPGSEQQEKALETIERGQSQRSLGGVAGSGGGEAVTLATLAKMDDDAFAKYADNPRKWRALNGGA